MSASFKRNVKGQGHLSMARRREAVSAHAAGFDTQSPLQAEERREHQVKYILKLCELLNEQGDQVELKDGLLAPWTPKTLNIFIRGEFGDEFDIDSLSFEYLLKLKAKLNLRLDEYLVEDAVPVEV